MIKKTEKKFCLPFIFLNIYLSRDKDSVILALQCAQIALRIFHQSFLSLDEDPEISSILIQILVLIHKESKVDLTNLISNLYSTLQQFDEMIISLFLKNNSWFSNSTSLYHIGKI